MFATMLFCLFTVFAVGEKQTVTPTRSVVEPGHQVIVYYFHRTVRCPTCKRIGSLVEEAVTASFAKEIKQGIIEFRYVDFQDEKNAKLVKFHKIETPTLVLANVVDGKERNWTALPKVWPLVGKPQELRDYVQKGVANSLKPVSAASESKE